MVEVFVNSIQQPEEELLRVVLGVALELQGALGHHVLQRDKHNTAQVDCSSNTDFIMKYSARLTRMLISAIRKVSRDAARRAEKLLKTRRQIIDDLTSLSRCWRRQQGESHLYGLSQGQARSREVRGLRPGRLPVPSLGTLVLILRA